MAVADPSSAALERFVAEADPDRAPATHSDAEALLGATTVDALYVCVPPFAHGAPERAALRAGIPFFVEKPLAADWSIAEALGAEIADRGAITATGYHWRNLDLVDRARAFLEGRPPHLVCGAWLDKVPPVAWWTRRERSGGQTVEQVTHLLDVMVDLVGEVREVHAVGAQVERSAHPDADIDGVSGATLRFASGAVGTMVSTSLLAAKHRAAVELFGDGYAMSLNEEELVIDRGDGSEVVRVAADGEAKRQVDRDFLEAVRSGDATRPRAPYATALRTHRLACALAESAAQERTVVL